MSELTDTADAAAAELADLRRQVAELRREVLARDDFIAIAAHELRNPMTPIMAVAELALNVAHASGGACPARIVTLLERMQCFTQDFIQRSTRLLDVSRIEAGNLALVATEVDVSALVLSVAHRYEILAERHDCPIDLDIEDKVAGIWDRLATEQVIDNLLSNAVKFGAGKPLRLRLRSDGSWMRLEVQDRGIGMTPDQQARLFTRFEQVVARHRGSGFGVGLWLANRLVMAMGGRIDVSSRLGEGSTFTVALPIGKPEPSRTTGDDA